MVEWISGGMVVPCHAMADATHTVQNMKSFATQAIMARSYGSFYI
jgi:hypothetical protein